MFHGTFDTEKVGIEVSVTHSKTYLAIHAGRQIVLRDRLDRLLTFGRIPNQIDGLRGDAHFMNLLPWPLEVGSTRRNHPDLGILVSLLLIRGKVR